MKNNTPRIILAGTNSGCGKTTLTCGLLKALSNRNIGITAFKCGPDYIDTMFHEKAINTPSFNLDSYLLNENTIKYLFNKNTENSEMAIIEGVMGFYDGIMLNSSQGSSYEISQITLAPVILIINCKGMSTSAVAILKGFKDLKKNNNISGVIFNNTSEKVYKYLANECNNLFDGKIKPLGYLKKLPDECIFENRHLGLITADEINDIKTKLDKLANICEETIDIDGIIKLAQSSKEIEFDDIEIKSKQKIKIAVAKDNAFCFYYKDNINLLKKMGAEIYTFSPLNNEILPDDIDGIYIGGGYPELYTDILEKNTDTKNSILKHINNNVPTIAECGGYMYLSSKINGKKMVGYFDGKFENKNKLVRFGYQSIKSNVNGLLLEKEQEVHAHEFHYYDCDLTNNNDLTATKPNGTKWDFGYQKENIYGAFPHIHFYSDIKIAEKFYNKCLERKLQK